MTQPARSRSAAPNSGWVKTGTAALDALNKAEKENAERRERGFMPLRMWVPRNEEIEIIILDEAFVSDEPGVGGALIREHNLKDSEGKWGNFESCCTDFANCPLCDKAGSEGFGASTFVVMLTCLVLKEWTNKKTGEVHAYSRMLLPIKLGQKEKFLELQKHAMRDQGSMRGLYLIMKRGSGDQSVSTGEPTMLENGKLYDLITEEELLADYGHPPVKNREGKVIKPANGDLEPFNYAELFPRPDPDDLARRFGVRQSGSRRSVADDWDKDQEQTDASPATQEAAPARRRRGGAQEPAQEPAQEAIADEVTQPATSTRRRGAASAPAQESAPARRRGGSKPAAGGKDPW